MKLLWLVFFWLTYQEKLVPDPKSRYQFRAEQNGKGEMTDVSLELENVKKGESE